MSIKNILVIGGCGFVGSNLCESLIKSGNQVVSLDNYFTGTQDNHVEGVRYVRGNARDISEINFEMDFSLIFHLGEYSRVEQSFEDIDIVFEYNMGPIYHVLRFCRVNDCKLIYSGSSTKFGDNGASGDTSPYAWTKKTNTDLVKTYCGWFGIEYAITYFYNVYGPREISEGKYSTLISKYISLVQTGVETLPVVKPGTQMRNFTHVDDIVDGLLVIGSKGSGDGYGIGNDEAFSIIDVVDLFDKDVEWLPERKGNRMSAPVNSSMTKALGWKCKRDLKSYVYSVTANS